MTITITREEFIREWVQELRDGDYDQGYNFLHRLATETRDAVRDSFCCLGVACEIGLRYGLVARGEDVTHYVSIGYDDGTSTLLPMAFAQWLGLEQDPMVRVDSDWEPVSTLNDDAGWTFPKLADVIEETYLR
jgi:hypothetical protein